MVVNKKAHLTPRGKRLRETTGSRDAPGKQVYFFIKVKK